MTDLVVDHDHPLGGVVFAALSDGRFRQETTTEMMARAARAVLAAEPQMSLGEAFFLINRLWVK